MFWTCHKAFFSQVKGENMPTCTASPMELSCLWLYGENGKSLAEESGVCSVMNLAVSCLCYVAEIAVLLWSQLHYMLMDKRVIYLPPSLSPSLLHFPPRPCFPFLGGWFVCFMGFLGCTGSSSLLHKFSVVSGGCSLVTALALLIALASPVVEPRF